MHDDKSASDYNLEGGSALHLALLCRQVAAATGRERMTQEENEDLKRQVTLLQQQSEQFTGRSQGCHCETRAWCQCKKRASQRCGCETMAWFREMENEDLKRQVRLLQQESEQFTALSQRCQRFQAAEEHAINFSSGLKKLKTSGPPLADFATTTTTFDSFPALLCHWLSPKGCIRLLKVNNSLRRSLNGHPIIGKIRARRETLLDAHREAQCSPLTLYAIWTIKFRQPNEWWLLQQVKQHPTILITVFPPGFVQPLDGVVLTFLADESLIRVTFRGGVEHQIREQ